MLEDIIIAFFRAVGIYFLLFKRLELYNLLKFFVIVAYFCNLSSLFYIKYIR